MAAKAEGCENWPWTQPGVPPELPLPVPAATGPPPPPHEASSAITGITSSKHDVLWSKLIDETSLS